MKKGWETKRLGEQFETVTGNTPKKSHDAYFGRYMPLVKPPELQDSEVSAAEDGLSEEGVRVARVAPPESILVSCIGNIGKIGFSTTSVAFNQQINAIIPNPICAFPRFMFYQTLSCQFRDQLNAMATGTTVSIVNKSRFNSINIVLPPLPEQQRIVSVLDEAFAGLATAQANAEKNLQNARALFDSHLQAVFSSTDSFVSLSSLATDITDGDHSPPPKSSTGIPFITISDINKRTGTIDFGNTFMVPELYFQDLKPNKKPRIGDVLYTVTGATLGIPILVREQRDFCFQRHIGLIRPNQDTDSAWLTYALGSPQVFRQATLGSSGAAQKTVSLSVLRGLQLPRVALSEQKLVAAKLDALSAETQRLARIYEQKKAALVELKKALLHQAFSGEL